MQEGPIDAVSAVIGPFCLLCDVAGLLDYPSYLAYLTTDWKRGEVRRLANWLSEEE